MTTFLQKNLDITRSGSNRDRFTPLLRWDASILSLGTVGDEEIFATDEATGNFKGVE